jgi:hypothetical protein
MTSIASRGEFAMRIVLIGPFSETVSMISAAEKKSSSTMRRSRPRSSQYLTILASIGVVMPVLNSFEWRLVTSKLGVNWTPRLSARVLRVVVPRMPPSRSR